MLTSGATDASVTQRELLEALGRTRNIQALEATYKAILEEYLVGDIMHGVLDASLKDIMGLYLRTLGLEFYFAGGQQAVDQPRPGPVHQQGVHGDSQHSLSI